MKRLLLIFFLLSAGPTMAANQDHDAIRQAVAAFVQQQTAAIPGKVDFSVSAIDRRTVLAQCARLVPFMPSGSQLIGQTMVGVRCADHDGWRIFVPVQVRIRQDLLVSARQLPRDHLLQEGDISRRSTEINQTTGYTDPNQVVGKVLRYGITAGQILREDMLRAPFQVTQGQVVQLRAQGSGYSIRSEGVAMNNASEGQSVKVRISSGRVISGIAREDGTVEVKP